MTTWLTRLDVLLKVLADIASSEEPAGKEGKNFCVHLLADKNLAQQQVQIVLADIGTNERPCLCWCG